MESGDPDLTGPHLKAFGESIVTSPDDQLEGSLMRTFQAQQGVYELCITDIERGRSMKKVEIFIGDASIGIISMRVVQITQISNRKT
mgnify:CR=1 FL=1